MQSSIEGHGGKSSEALANPSQDPEPLNHLQTALTLQTALDTQSTNQSLEAPGTKGTEDLSSVHSESIEVNRGFAKAVPYLGVRSMSHDRNTLKGPRVQQSAECYRCYFHHHQIDRA